MADETTVGSKPWYASKTLWANVLLGLGVVLTSAFKFSITPEEQSGIIILVNLILRAVSKDKITLS